MAMWRSGRLKFRSRSLDRGAEPGERVAQAFIPDIGHVGGEPRDLLGVGPARGGFPRLPLQRRLADLDARDRAPAEEAVHLLQNDAREVLDFQRHRPLDAQHQRRRLRIVLVHPARPDHAHRLAVLGDLRADDLRPVRHDAGRGEALFGECVLDRLRDELAQGLRVRARLVQGSRLCQIGSMSLAVKAPPQKAVPNAADLLRWYDRHRRVLPWRAKKGERADPYRVWLSEIMLQQTTVKAVAPYYARFLARFPGVAALAQAPLEDVLKLWAGLGYYARARNLHACAKAVVAQHGGEFPDREEGLRALPGVGPYTAAAIAAIAFDRPASPVDGNIERVIARLFAVEAAQLAPNRAIPQPRRPLLPPPPPAASPRALRILGPPSSRPKNPAFAFGRGLGHCV